MWRLLLALPCGLALSASLFVLLAEVSGINPRATRPANPLSNVHLFTLRSNSDTQRRSRELPNPPAPETSQQSALVLPLSGSKQNNRIAPPDAPSISNLLQTSLSPQEIALPQLVTVEQSTPIAHRTLGLAKGPQLDLSIQAQYQHPPEYPMSAHRRGIEGVVELEFTVNTKGKVVASSIKVLSAEPAGIFEQAAIRSVSQSRFPIKYQGSAVPFISRQKIGFKLNQ
ncbi:energy transducer TonB [Agarivorans sp. MS3-6]|uniref:energy transducer TonB n=1 Tax=Agarivorans sp. TSD2052 TaxID=2937286 RepID=UPI00200EBF97|nr:energy transducer TonB [Agarivorans sp. TSD2052]UPW19298.1 energy transducer TonB [Agarivorans sp. TSD2052]